MNGWSYQMFAKCLVDTCSFDLHRAAVEEASHSERLRGILQFTDKPIVSSDIVGNPHSSIYDAGFTGVTGGRYLRVLNWYDNEWGYSSRVCDLLARMETL